MAPNVRLYVEHRLAEDQTVPPTEAQSRYLFAVMRLQRGDPVHLFNGSDGEWRSEVAAADKRHGMLVCREMTRRQEAPPDLWLVFAPIKKARTDFIVEKAAELGAAQILPVQTEFTNSERVRRDRLQAHAVEAAEQCGGTFVPPVDDLVPLARLLDGWPAERRLMFCDEALAGAPALVREDGPLSPWAILIGPEGGFSQTERERLRALPQAVPVSLGPRILRADTAAVAALTLWQVDLGDWR